MYIAAAGGAVAAGQPVTLTIDGLPHHSRTPIYLALALALVVLGSGVLFARRPVVETRAAERKQLIARREKLFQDLVRLENDRRKGQGAPARYASRREEILAA